MMPINAAGLIVNGQLNPNWKGGNVDKQCEHCAGIFAVRPGRANSARFCSLACCNRSADRKRILKAGRNKSTTLICVICSKPFSVLKCVADKYRCCSRACGGKWRSKHLYRGGRKRHPYPLRWRFISQDIMARDGFLCQNPRCKEDSAKLNVHHIDYNKANCSPLNLITVCQDCNLRANANREYWQRFYQELIEELAEREPLLFGVPLDVSFLDSAAEGAVWISTIIS